MTRNCAFCQLLFVDNTFWATAPESLNNSSGFATRFLPFSGYAFPLVGSKENCPETVVHVIWYLDCCPIGAQHLSYTEHNNQSKKKGKLHQML